MILRASSCRLLSIVGQVAAQPLQYRERLLDLVGLDAAHGARVDLKRESGGPGAQFPRERLSKNIGDSEVLAGAPGRSTSPAASSAFNTATTAAD